MGIKHYFKGYFVISDHISKNMGSDKKILGKHVISKVKYRVKYLKSMWESTGTSRVNSI